uniref:Uncharacterized protein n=1 Tax=Romanomermis culicivorax TaxID=13658 RepID=A0A915HKX6_ROMCU
MKANLAAKRSDMSLIFTFSSLTSMKPSGIEKRMTVFERRLEALKRNRRSFVLRVDIAQELVTKE